MAQDVPPQPTEEDYEYPADKSQSAQDVTELRTNVAESRNRMAAIRKKIAGYGLPSRPEPTPVEVPEPAPAEEEPSGSAGPD